MPGRDIIVIGASAGGIEVLSQVVRDLPAELPAALLVVQHFPANATSQLPLILNRAGALPAIPAREGEPIQPGRIYVAMPDHHLLVKPGRLHLARGPRENGFRPAVDPLFRTAARVYGPRVVGVVLSGNLDDGTAGLLVIKRAGGVAVVQDPDEAFCPGMPLSAIENVAVDHVLPVGDIPAVLIELARQPLEGEGATYMAREEELEPDVAEATMDALQSHTLPGPPSVFTCPECGGSLWEMHDSGLLRFRCHLGHGYSSDGLLAAQNGAVEDALWIALRALEENAALARRLAERSESRGSTRVAGRFEEQALDLQRRANLLRQVLLKDPGASENSTGEPLVPAGEGPQTGNQVPP